VKGHIYTRDYIVRFGFAFLKFALVVENCLEYERAIRIDFNNEMPIQIFQKRSVVLYWKIACTNGA
jgi:hypothetical protein